MTKCRNKSGGGGALNGVLCKSPKGGGACDCRKCTGYRVSIQDRRLFVHGKPHASISKLAGNQLGADAGPHADGCERYLSSGQRGRRGTAYADGDRDSVPFPLNERLDYRNRGQRRCYGAYGERIPSNLQQFQPNHQAYRRRSAPQQPAPVPIGVHLASDSLIPERGCAA